MKVLSFFDQKLDLVEPLTVARPYWATDARSGWSSAAVDGRAPNAFVFAEGGGKIGRQWVPAEVLVFFDEKTAQEVLSAVDYSLLAIKIIVSRSISNGEDGAWKPETLRCFGSPGLQVISLTWRILPPRLPIASLIDNLTSVHLVHVALVAVHINNDQVRRLCDKLVKCPDLSHLDLSANRFWELDGIASVLRGCPRLKHLDLGNMMYIGPRNRPLTVLYEALLASRSINRATLVGWGDYALFEAWDLRKLWWHPSLDAVQIRYPWGGWMDNFLSAKAIETLFSRKTLLLKTLCLLLRDGLFEGELSPLYQLPHELRVLVACLLLESAAPPQAV